MDKPGEEKSLIEQMLGGMSPAEPIAGVSSLAAARAAMTGEDLEQRPRPTLLPVPEQAVGFRLRLDLVGSQPPIWRRLEVPGDLLLPKLHAVIQDAMGWEDYHLHRFRMGRDYGSPEFSTEFDIDEGAEGAREDDVRLDQVVSTKGDTLWYEYDFGDSWDHSLVVEAVLDEPPAVVHCVAGQSACPPEDCGGLGGYAELAAWVRSGYPADLVPHNFADAEHARHWLPDGWDPDRFSLEEVNAALALTLAEPAAVIAELQALNQDLEDRGGRRLRTILSRPLSHAPIDVSESEAARLTTSFRTFLDVIGDGVKLTAAGYLPPSVVTEVAERIGVPGWWLGRSNREERTYPVAELRITARALGLVSVRHGRLTPTAIAAKTRSEPLALWKHIVSRLPLGTKEFERHAGLLNLAVAGSGTPEDGWSKEVRELLASIGWRTTGGHLPANSSPTASALGLLAGSASRGWSASKEVDEALAATARAAIRRQEQSTK